MTMTRHPTRTHRHLSLPRGPHLRGPHPSATLPTLAFLIPPPLVKATRYLLTCTTTSKPSLRFHTTLLLRFAALRCSSLPRARRRCQAHGEPPLAAAEEEEEVGMVMVGVGGGRCRRSRGTTRTTTRGSCGRGRGGRGSTPPRSSPASRRCPPPRSPPP